MELKTHLPRFDRHIVDLNSSKRAADSKRAFSTTRFQAMQEVGGRRCKSYFESIDYKIGARHEHHNATNDAHDPNRTVFGGRFVNTMGSKLDFLAGQKDVVMYQDKNRPKNSSYQIA